jgi:hypothetical protein
LKLSQFQDLLLTLAEQHPEFEAFNKCTEFEKVIMADPARQVPNIDFLLKDINQLLVKMTALFVIVKQNESFTRFFGIDAQSIEAETHSKSTTPMKA